MFSFQVLPVIVIGTLVKRFLFLGTIQEKLSKTLYLEYIFGICIRQHQNVSVRSKYVF